MSFDIEGYLLKREIGSGGMATVYLAVQQSLDRQVALKVMAPALVADRTFTRRFLREARTVAQLAHPNVVSIYDVGVSADQLHYFSMEYLPSGDFAERIRSGVSEAELLRVLTAIAGALAFAHERGYVHRDVKPGNILFDPVDNPVLTDFGIARAASTSTRMTGSGVSVGTSHYMSPEQARGREVDGRADLYSLGVVAFEALVGRPPFDGEDGFAVAYSHVFDPVPRLPGELAAWQPFIHRALAKRPEDRFPDAQAMIEALRAIRAGAHRSSAAGSEPAHQPTAPLPKVTARRASPARHAAIWLATLKGVPGTRRYALLRGLGLAWRRAQHEWRRACRRLFPFLEPEQQRLAGLVAGFSLLAVLGMLVFRPEAPAPRGSGEPTRVADAGTGAGGSGRFADGFGEGADAAGAPPERGAAGRAAQGGGTVTLDEGEAGSREPPEAVAAAGEPATAAVPAVALAVDEPPPGTDEAALPGEGFAADGPAAGADAAAASGAEALAGPGEESGPGSGPGSGAPPPARFSREVRETLAAADEDLAADRLTTPAGTNAYERYRAVLALDAANPRALAGLEAVVDRYLVLAEAAVKAGNASVAALLLDRAQPVAARVDRTASIARARERLAEMPAMAERFRDPLASGGEGPEMLLLELRPFRIEEGDARIGVTGTRRLAVSASEITRADYARFVAATGHYEQLREPVCRHRESPWRGSRSRTWDNPGFSQSDDHPVVCVSWEDAAAMARWLSAETGLVYRLPTETEWEFLASRAAPRHASPCELDNFGDIWLKASYPGRGVLDCEDGWTYTAPVTSFPPNALGMYGLLGNVREWTADCWTEPRGDAASSWQPHLEGDCGARVVKGLSWFQAGEVEQVLRREDFDKDLAYDTIGFRLVRSVD